MLGRPYLSFATFQILFPVSPYSSFDISSKHLKFIVIILLVGLNIQIGIRALTVLMWGILRMLTLAITIYLLFIFLLKFLFLILLCVLHLTCMHVCVLRVCLLTTEARQVISFSWFWVADSCELQQPWCENWILDPLAEHLPSLCSSPLVNNSC